jgi:O-methyltransferase
MMRLQDRGINKPALDLARERSHHRDITEEDFWEIVPLAWDYTELPTEILYNLYCSTRYIVANNIEGDIIECGVHMGGSIMAIAHVLKKFDKSTSRRLFALDTFTGFVRRTEGLDIDIESGRDACLPEGSPIDLTDGATANMRSIGYERLEIVKGDVLETIPALNVKKIAMLRCDTDTYDTTKLELESLYDSVTTGGVVIIDDYGYTFGCKKAVDDFIAPRKILLQRINRNVRAWVKALD